MRKNLSILLILLAVFVSACATKNPEAFYFGSYSEAEYLYGKGEYEKAIQKYQEYVDENPEGNMAVISQYYIAKSRVELGQVDQAKMIFNNIIQNHPDVVWANFSETQLAELDS